MVRLMVAAGLTVAGAAACTSSAGGPAPASTRPSAATAPTSRPAPVLTPLDTLRCVVQRTITTDRGGLPPDSVKPAEAVGAATEGPVETVPGADAAACPGALPAAGCDEPSPWSRPGDERFFTASRATRRVEGVVTWSLVSKPPPSQSAAADGVNDLQSIGYGVLNLKRGDPGRVLAYLERVVRQCDSAIPLSVGGRRALVGTVTSQFRQGPADVVLLTSQDAAAWLLLDGTTQLSDTELARIVSVAASRLLPS
ncbi:hypothetical protein [Humibacillus sp. DSM 29435]|uniref:hypothetical protein n=1 Tax=Humibacillus sp. DSM 29435 TaxID=1869167 RepID=UPI0011130D5C|nr:hypothetical protein [Humibacillus sp. DSM 29435]